MKNSLLALLLVGCVACSSAAAKNPVVVMKTSKGTIKIELYEDKAPETVKNFLKYVEDKHYDGTVFHRVIKDFMIQGGGYAKGVGEVKDIEGFKKKEKTTRDPIKNESTNGLENKKYTLAMARTNAPNSATAQFFINVKDNDFLDRARARDKVGYCVFGKVIEGEKVVDEIKGVKTKVLIKDEDGDALIGDVPVDEVVIESVRREESK